MIEDLMSRSLSGDHQGGAAGFIRLHVRGLRSHQSLIAQVVVCATGAVHTDIFRSIRYLPESGPKRSSKPVTRPVRQNSWIPPNRITRAAKRRRWRCRPSSLSKHSMSSGCRRQSGSNAILAVNFRRAGDPCVAEPVMRTRTGGPGRNSSDR